MSEPTNKPFAWVELDDAEPNVAYVKYPNGYAVFHGSRHGRERYAAICAEALNKLAKPEGGGVSATITFTDDELELLQEMTSAYEDCGPRDEGWKSPEARALNAKIYAIWHEKHKDVLGERKP